MATRRPRQLGVSGHSWAETHPTGHTGNGQRRQIHRAGWGAQAARGGGAFLGEGKGLGRHCGVVTVVRLQIY